MTRRIRRSLLGLGGRRQPLGVQTGQNERIERVSGPAGVLDRGDRCRDRRQERPVRLPLGALLDPPLEQVDLLGRQRSAQRLGRHPLALVLGGDTRDQIAVLKIARHDGVASRLVRAEGSLLRVEPQPGLALPRVGAVAVEALVRQDRPDLKVEVDLSCLASAPRSAAVAAQQQAPTGQGRDASSSTRSAQPASHVGIAVSLFSSALGMRTPGHLRRSWRSVRLFGPVGFSRLIILVHVTDPKQRRPNERIGPRSGPTTHP